MELQILRTRVNGSEEQLLFLAKDGKSGVYNDLKFELDVREIKKGQIHLLIENRSLIADILEADYSKKAFVVRINGRKYHVEIKDQFDTLLQELGLDAIKHHKANDIKAPMPGMVLSVLVETGQKVQKGETVLVLEAMKMENVLRTVTEGTVKKILVNNGDKVEKNQILVEMQ